MTTAAYLGEFEQLLLLAILRSEEHTSELQSQSNLVCRLLLEKKKKNILDDMFTKQVAQFAFYFIVHLSGLFRVSVDHATLFNVQMFYDVAARADHVSRRLVTH